MSRLFVSRRTYEAVCADRERIRGERNQFEKDRDVHKGNAVRATRELAEARGTICRLTGRIDELLRRNTTGSIDPAEARQAIAVWEQQVKEREAWTPPETDGVYAEGVTGRPVHPALLLRRAMDRCRALEARLTVAEGRKRAVSES